MIKVRNEEGEYPCYICPEILNSKKDLRQHTINVHKKNKVCPTCSSSFKDISSVRRHIKSVHVKEKQFVCSLCERRYMHKYDLENHFTKKHSSTFNCNDRKVCPDCQAFFTSTTQLMEHMQKTHKKTINYSKFVSDVLETFTSHMSSCHSWESTLICTRKGCNKYFQTEDELLSHLKTHPKQTWTRKKSEASSFKCWECGSQCETREMMVTHFTDLHSCLPRFECKACSTFFRDKDDLSMHIPCTNQSYTDFVELTIHQNTESCSSYNGEGSQQLSKKRKITPLVTGIVDFQS
ncbi:zinc finger and BTB domain-containing protein 41-like [Bolinopsis microptera]|uniref:zinc finger and BTB domain-containing protein 41-like n=1 Tax=Bolinopsis microptera TaxID=2820187 RepID=UPI00307960DE